MTTNIFRRLPFPLFILVLLLSSCIYPAPEPTFAPPIATTLSASQPAVETATVTPTLPPPETPVPLAVLVNGEGVTLAEYQAELARFQAAASPEQAEQAGETGALVKVLDYLIDQALLAQAAPQAGFVLDEQAFQERMDGLVAGAGGESAFQAWLQANGYTIDSFRLALQKAVAAAWMRDQILLNLPDTAEQIHARQILLYNSVEANQVLAQVQSGTDFATLAERYDPALGGDLGWFPKGYLTEPLVEEAAFGLQPDGVSAVIETRLGFHILEVIERAPQRPLDPDARKVLQEQLLIEWLAARRSQSEIQVFVPGYSE